ncbi:Probable protein phosphatase 2C 76 [Linum perenne]
MVVGRSCLRSLVVQAVLISQTRLLTSNIARRSCSSPIVGRRLNNNTWSSSFFSARTNMMVDSESAAAAAAKGGTAVGGLQPEKEEGGGYVSGGRKSDDGKLSCGYSSFRGKRATMEDFYDIKTTKINEKPVCMFGIFDGHGGSRASEYLKQHLFDNLMKHPQFMTDTKAAISATYQQTDADFLDSEKDTYRDDGSTASTAVLVGDHLYVANVGDSRTVEWTAIALSEDHKPNRSDERKRIEGAGGVVMWAGTWRVGGVLAMSRAFGNRMLKQYVVAEPEIQDLKLDDEIELLVLASDGLWDVVPNEDAVTLAKSEEEPEAAAKKLVETAFTKGSADNITCIVVKLNRNHKADRDHKADSPPNPPPPKDNNEKATES